MLRSIFLMSPKNLLEKTRSDTFVTQRSGGSTERTLNIKPPVLCVSVSLW
jgi:hypothetical protein